MGDGETPTEIEIEALVREVRQKCEGDIQTRCGTMRVLDMSCPIGLGDIYTNVNILEKISAKSRKSIEEMLQGFDLENFDRFGLGGIQKTIPGLEAVAAHSKLIILGKPGAGKTTFLKHLAMQCHAGRLQADRVPVFISLKDFAESPGQPSLLEFIAARWAGCGVGDRQAAEKILAAGRALILLDGLDEVREADSKRVLTEIREESIRFRNSNFVVTCRIAAREYAFEQFTEVEVADFSDEQIAEFAGKWFAQKQVTAKSFIDKLKESKPIKELATNPLLLTLLCLVFEESGNFAPNRSELYKEGLDILLKKWSAKRGIERDWAYKSLSVQKREDMLSQIALTTFAAGDYFFKQKQVEGYIKDYIRNTLNANTDEELLNLDSEGVLKAIEAQHGLLVERASGIYSFSHLTFHEYLTAREIVNNPDPQELAKVQMELVSHITEKRWREVFLLAVGMSRSADYLLQLMKQKIDSLLATDLKLQDFLAWVWEKSNSIEKYKPAAVRAFYFARARDLARARARDLALALARDRARDLALDLDLARARARARARAHIEPGSEFYHALQALRDRLPDPKGDRKTFRPWWEGDGKVWIEEFRQVLIKYRNIGHDWQFSDTQKDLLKQYYDANKLLVDCLKSDCYVSKPVRRKIEDTLLLPIAMIEKYEEPGD